MHLCKQTDTFLLLFGFIIKALKSPDLSDKSVQFFLSPRLFSFSVALSANPAQNFPAVPVPFSAVPFLSAAVLPAG